MFVLLIGLLRVCGRAARVGSISTTGTTDTSVLISIIVALVVLTVMCTVFVLVDGCGRRGRHVAVGVGVVVGRSVFGVVHTTLGFVSASFVFVIAGT